MMVVDGGGGGGGFVLGYIFCNTWVIDEVPYTYVYIQSFTLCDKFCYFTSLQTISYAYILLSYNFYLLSFSQGIRIILT